MQKFSNTVTAHRLALQNLLLSLNKKNKTIVGIGAPAKGNTLLNTCHLGKEVVECLVEKSNLKIGLFSTGMHVPVVDEKVLFTKPPDYGLILSWNIADELIKKLRQKGFTGRFIIPFPQPRVK